MDDENYIEDEAALASQETSTPQASYEEETALKLNRDVATYRDSAVVAGQALAEIKANDYWVILGYDSYNHYCHAGLQKTRQYANLLVRASIVHQKLVEIDAEFDWPKSEGLLRELDKVKDIQQCAKLYKELRGEHKVVTAIMIMEAAAKFKGQTPSRAKTSRSFPREKVVKIALRLNEAFLAKDEIAPVIAELLTALNIEIPVFQNAEGRAGNQARAA